ncbi:Gustatory receptor 28b [Carabus blaptoides fortunei]
MLVNKGAVGFYVIQKALGVAPYMVSKGKFFVNEYMNIQSGIGSFLLSIYVLLCLHKVLHIPGKMLISYITVSVASLSLFHVMFRQKAAVNANNEIATVSAGLGKFIKIKYTKLLVLRVIEFLFSVSLVTGISIFLVISSPQSEWYTCMGMVYAMSVRVLMVNHFLWLVYAVKINVVAINELLDNRKNYVAEQLVEIAQLQNQLRVCAINANDAFSVPLLCWCIESFAKICYTSYHLTICILYPIFPTCGPEKNESFFIFLWYLIQLWYMISLCHLTALAGIGTTKRVHRILREIPNDQVIREELELFSFQLGTKFNYNASGFFVVDYTFLTTLAGLVTTYVIIFVQFFIIDNSTDSRPIEAAALDIISRLY